MVYYFKFEIESNYLFYITLHFIVMKKLVFVLFLFLVNGVSFAQGSEFGNSKNGLIYSENTMGQLKFIVDSLNLKFKVCDLNKVYLAKMQAKANHISLEGKESKAAQKDLEANISFDAFVKKYSKCTIDTELLVIKYLYKNYKNADILEFRSVSIGDRNYHQIDFKENLKKYNKALKNNWVFTYSAKTNYSKESIEAFFFIDDFHSDILETKYAKMIQYSDCMVDTSTQVFYESSNNSYRGFMEKNGIHMTNFMSYLNKVTDMPVYKNISNTNVNETYYERYKVWDSLKFIKVDSIRTINTKFDDLLKKATTEALLKAVSDDLFEEIVARYNSKKIALELKRHRVVVGGCSQDQSPRFHALNIAKLSAETVNWEVFLRSHLDIMNDRFERASDGSYAWEARKTYIKELEVLDINVMDLLLGISLRIDNPSHNHYYGSINRIGRALSETNKAKEIETKMLEMISDNTLDDYNRILIYYLFLNYNYNLSDIEKQKVNVDKLKIAVNSLPKYISSKITKEK
jgi:hypothetical protein